MVGEKCIFFVSKMATYFSLGLHMKSIKASGKASGSQKRTSSI
jgi:hypothetical protein